MASALKGSEHWPGRADNRVVIVAVAVISLGLVVRAGLIELSSFGTLGPLDVDKRVYSDGKEEQKDANKDVLLLVICRHSHVDEKIL